MTLSQHAEQPLSRHAFPRQARLLTRAQYQSVFDLPQGRSTDRCLTVLARQNGVDQPRLGLAISKRSAKTAVARNRLKRLVRESFRQHQQVLEGLDIIVLGRDAAQNESNPNLQQSLRRHWQRVVEQCATC